DEHFGDAGGTLWPDSRHLTERAVWYLLRGLAWGQLPYLALEDVVQRYGYKLGRRLHRLGPGLRERVAPGMAADERRPDTDDLAAWLRWKCGLSGGAAAERVRIARQMENLPRTQQAFVRGDVGYQQVAAIARTADHIGVDAVRRGESSLLEAAARLDGGQFTSVAKNFEHQVDAAGALAEANRAHQRRYLHLGEPTDGLVRVDGLLDTEGGAIVKTALNAFMLPGKDDDRTP